MILQRTSRLAVVVEKRKLLQPPLRLLSPRLSSRCRILSSKALASNPHPHLSQRESELILTRLRSLKRRSRNMAIAQPYYEQANEGHLLHMFRFVIFFLHNAIYHFSQTYPYKNQWVKVSRRKDNQINFRYFLILAWFRI